MMNSHYISSTCAKAVHMLHSSKLSPMTTTPSPSLVPTRDDEDIIEMFPEHLLASVQIDTDLYPVASEMVEVEHDHIC